ncbi:Benzoylformate decarboxylase [Tolypocladium capitatum]|uniref:Benzoylformate decarboxylase n=1 Tax=Tolypocladium capitatum TaxID=45235 RepID=A0A2K3QCE5_9HYPO|nr:Benzoylformate decarboxylase [Tolypocladium capitatum]
MALLRRAGLAAPALWRCRPAAAAVGAVSSRLVSTRRASPRAAVPSMPIASTRRPAQAAPTPASAPASASAHRALGRQRPGITTRQASTSSAMAADPGNMYTASFAFFEAIWEAGITHCFVNLGSDHPSIIEAMVKGRREAAGRFPRIITCPNEMVAMSMADGYARLTGKPQCVIVHVDVGTQGLGAAVHNASTGRAPVLVFAGLSPFTLDGELRGSRTEFIHWIQDVPDQKQIVAQYCRYAAEIKTGTNVKQMVNRALQFAKSDPQGPVYLCGAREVMEADIERYSLKQEDWDPVQLGCLPPNAVDGIADALAGAERPVLVTSYAGRNQKVPGALVDLANTVKGLQVVDCGGSDMCFPADHPAWRGLRFGVDDVITKADVIVVVDCDVPWIPTRCRPREDARIFHIDIDPLKQQMPLFYIEAGSRYRADALMSIEQITAALKAGHAAAKLRANDNTQGAERVKAEYDAHLADITERAKPLEDGSFGTGYLSRTLKDLCPEDTLWAVEAVTNTVFVHDNIRPTMPGSWINCGGGGLGWSGGGALGVKLATDAENNGKGKFVVQIVGDGSYLFSVPGSVYWISKRYNIPVLTIVLNNKGWHAPRRSLLLVHPDGLGSKASDEEANISFDPVPDYSGIAKAAADGNIHAARVTEASELEGVLKEAIAKVQAGQTAVIDCRVVPGC